MRTSLALVVSMSVVFGCDDDGLLSESGPGVVPIASERGLAGALRSDEGGAVEPVAEELAEREPLVEVTERLARARTHVQASEYAEARALFDEIVTDRPNSAALRCEAGFVALRDDDLVAAHRLIDAAIPLYGAPEDRDGQHALARCLFNLGLVLERGERFVDAMDAFERSLALRPNDSVRRHSTEARSRVDEDEIVRRRDAAAERRRVLREPNDDLDLLARMMGRYYGQAPTRITRRTPSGSAGLCSAAVVVVSDSTAYLVVQGKSGWEAIADLTRGAPFSASRTEFDAWPAWFEIDRFEFEDLLPLEGNELRVTFTSSRADVAYPHDDGGDPSGAAAYAERFVERIEIVCGSGANDRVACFEVPLVRARWTGHAPGEPEFPRDTAEELFGTGFVFTVDYSVTGATIRSQPYARPGVPSANPPEPGGGWTPQPREGHIGAHPHAELLTSELFAVERRDLDR